jgi:hypothetical protein
MEYSLSIIQVNEGDYRGALMYIGKLRRDLNRISRAAVQGRDNDFIRSEALISILVQFEIG